MSTAVMPAMGFDFKGAGNGPAPAAAVIFSDIQGTLWLPGGNAPRQEYRDVIAFLIQNKDAAAVSLCSDANSARTMGVAVNAQLGIDRNNRLPIHEKISLSQGTADLVFDDRPVDYMSYKLHIVPETQAFSRFIERVLENKERGTAPYLASIIEEVRGLEGAYTPERPFVAVEKAAPLATPAVAA